MLKEYSGLSYSEIIRRMIVGTKIRERSKVETKEILRLLSGIGNNLNQIARTVNHDGTVSQKTAREITEMKKWLEDIWQIAKEM